MKIRLVGGPFSGKKLDYSGGDTIKMRGPKKETRAQKWERMRNHSNLYSPMTTPTVEALYRIAIRPHVNGNNVLNAPCQHPDGSLFYEYVKDSKHEYPY